MYPSAFTSIVVNAISASEILLSIEAQTSLGNNTLFIALATSPVLNFVIVSMSKLPNHGRWASMVDHPSVVLGIILIRPVGKELLAYGFDITAIASFLKPVPPARKSTLWSIERIKHVG